MCPMLPVSFLSITNDTANINPAADAEILRKQKILSQSTNSPLTRTALPEAIHDAKRHKTNSAPLYIHV